MLRTILLVDGSEAMNSASDYIPSYLIAMRTPILSYVREYLDSTPLASLGIVVMRNGVGQRLCPCTTSASTIADVLERDYFLCGGAGTASLENGLRMALSELVDLKSLVKQRAGDGPAAGGRPHGVAVKSRIVLLSASVTFVDPTDVLRVIAGMAGFHIHIDVITFTGAVHIFEECVRQTGGQLHCPLNYDHLLRIMHTMAVGSTPTPRGGSRNGPRCKRSRRDNDKDTARSKGDDEDRETRAAMVPIGFPVYVPRSTAGDSTSSAPASSTAVYHLACPQCHLLQTTVPTTCPLCKLLLCNVGMMYAAFVSHNHLVPPTTEAQLSRAVGGDGRQDRVITVDQPSGSARCDVCTEVITTEQAIMRQCTGCQSWRCEACHKYVVETIGLCPQCVALC